MRIERSWNEKILRLSQSDYIRKVLTLLPTLIQLLDRDCPLTDEENKLNGKIPYASAVGSIMYVMVTTRPDLAYAIGVVNRYLCNPGRKH